MQEFIWETLHIQYPEPTMRPVQLQAHRTCASVDTGSPSCCGYQGLIDATGFLQGKLHCLAQSDLVLPGLRSSLLLDFTR
jgi:hypothetical protein